MRWAFTADQERLRDEVRAFLAEHAHRRDPMQYFHGRGGASRELYRELGRRGWLRLAWPREWGGQDAPPSTEFIVWDELAYARAVRPDLAAGIVAKTIIGHGTDEQRARFLPGIGLGEISFALGYSEPEAGSDLAGVRTRAVPDGDGYRVTGEKRWTSDAHNSDYLWLLCRTPESGHTLLMLDLTAPGVQILPIHTIDGHRLNEVSLDDVYVPQENRIGAEGEAWRLIRAALAVERHLMVLPGRVRRDFEDLLRWSAERGWSADARTRDDIADIALDVAEVEVAAMSTLAALESGHDGAAQAARAKLLGSRTLQRIARLPFDVGDAGAARTGTPSFLWHETFMETIAGGTSEIMLGVLAREALGLGGRR
ncbi:acyl-CoA dehydrogenase family protein [Micromonospora rubida]